MAKLPGDGTAGRGQVATGGPGLPCYNTLQRLRYS